MEAQTEVQAASIEKEVKITEKAAATIREDVPAAKPVSPKPKRKTTRRRI